MSENQEKKDEGFPCELNSDCKLGLFCKRQGYEGSSSVCQKLLTKDQIFQIIFVIFLVICGYFGGYKLPLWFVFSPLYLFIFYKISHFNDLDCAGSGWGLCRCANGQGEEGTCTNLKSKGGKILLTSLLIWLVASYLFLKPLYLQQFDPKGKAVFGSAFVMMGAVTVYFIFMLKQGF